MERAHWGRPNHMWLLNSKPMLASVLFWFYGGVFYFPSVYWTSNANIEKVYIKPGCIPLFN